MRPDQPEDASEALDPTRDGIRKAYARALEEDGCGNGATPRQKGVAAKLAGYDADELKSLPVEAVANSFGCGNPLGFSEVEAGDVVLDLGCGAGIDLIMASRRVGPTGHVIGVDMTEEMVLQARRSLKRAGCTNVVVHRALIESLPVDSSSVDWVISNCVITLSPEKTSVFAEIARVLKPGGRMLVSDLVARDLPAGFLGGALATTCLATAIDEDAYLEGLARAGLVETRVESRLFYEASQIRALLASEVELIDEELDRVAASCEGNVWSVRLSARRGRG